MSVIPEKYMDLLTGKKAFGDLATVMRDGSPQVTPVWFDYKDGTIRVNTARGRVKDKNMAVRAKVALAIMDPANPYRHIQIRGRVRCATEAGADAHINALTKKYRGPDAVREARPGEIRVIFEIEPTSANTMG